MNLFATNISVWGIGKFAQQLPEKCPFNNSLNRPNPRRYGYTDSNYINFSF